MELKGTKTEQNLRDAFSAESEARNKYTFFASVAKKDGYEEISALFTKTANNEQAHAKIWFKALGALGDTSFNLNAGVEGEHYEWTTMYESYAKTAEEEGFLQLATQFRGVADIEKQHERNYQTALREVRDESVFAKESATAWECRNCGHVQTGKNAPLVCPVCQHPQAYFEVDSNS